MTAQHYIDTLARSPYKLTAPRRAVIEFLHRSRVPQPVKAIFRGVRGQGVDQASVYRAIGTLRQVGVVHQDHLLEQTCYYLAPSEHHHVVCRRCHRVECVPCHVEFRTPRSFRDIDHRLTLTGTCSSCAPSKKD